MLEYPVLVLVLCIGAIQLHAGEPLQTQDDDSVPVRTLPLAKPAATAKPACYSIRWATYRTDIVIEATAGLMRPAWIVTYATAPDQVETPQGKISIADGDVVVAYRGQAYLDAEGVLHIDGHGASLSGLLKEGWYPDSFDISSSLEVSSHDDNIDHPPSTGTVERVLYPHQDGNIYQALLLLAEAIIEDDS